MIDVERSLPAPSSLGEETGYRTEEVLERLHRDFLGKCYLCERTIASGCFEVDHRYPKAAGEYPERTHDWTNLFPICEGCNSHRFRAWRQRRPEGMVSPGEGVERRVRQWLEANQQAGRLVATFAAVDLGDVAARHTADELTQVHRLTESHGAHLQTQYEARLSVVQGVMIDLLHAVNTGDIETQSVKQAVLRQMLARDAPFTALLRGRVGETVSWYITLDP